MVTSVCRVCLVGNIRMLNVNNIQLEKIYEKLTNTKLNTGPDSEMPDTICYVCHRQLQKCFIFAEMAQESNIMLRHLLRNGNEVSMLSHGNLHKLSMTSTQCMSLDKILNSKSMPVAINDGQTVVKQEKTAETEQNDTEAPPLGSFDEDVKVCDDLNNKRDILHSCLYCNLIFVFKCELVNHLKVHNIPTITTEKHEAENETAEIQQNDLEVSFDKDDEICDDANNTVVSSFDVNSDVKNDSHDFYLCSHCNQKFVSKYKLVNHLKVHNIPAITTEKYEAENETAEIQQNDLEVSFDNDDEICDDANNTVVSSFDVNSDVKNDSHDFCLCSHCNQKFVSKYKLVNHLKVHNIPAITTEKHEAENETAEIQQNDLEVSFDNDDEICDDANNTVVSSFDVNSDVKNDSRDFCLCSHCNQKFVSKHKLVNHLKVCTVPETTTISQEAKNKTPEITNSTESLLLKKHMQIHTGERLNSCNISDATLEHHSSVTTDMKTHTGKRENVYCCDSCNQTFTKKNKLKSHMMVHSGKRPWRCTICHKTYIEKCTLEKHMRIHLHSCSYCDQKFVYKYLLVSHLKMHTKERSHSCQCCDKTFTSKSDLKSHKQIHIEENLHLCNICGKKLTSKRGLKQHILIHTVGNSHLCNICNKKFSSKVALNKHIRLHTGEKPYLCSICGEKFISDSKLNRHMQNHTGEKPFCCNECGKTFITNCDLKSHTAFIHTTERPYVCSKCYKTFSHQCNFKRHMKTHAEIREKPFSCNQCKKSFSRPCNLKRHMMIHFGKRPHCCTLCKKSFIENWSLVKHMQIHTGNIPYYCCDTCDKTFKVKSSLSKHIIVTHAGKKPYACNICDKAFVEKCNLARHMFTHTGVKAFCCNECDKRFSIKPKLAEHMLRMHTKRKIQGASKKM